MPYLYISFTYKGIAKQREIIRQMSKNNKLGY